MYGLLFEKTKISLHNSLCVSSPIIYDECVYSIPVDEDIRLCSANEFYLVLFWCCIDIFGWGLYLLFSVLADRIQAKAIWALNNDVRKNIYDSILRQNYKQYHKNDIGEYLSWVTNDIKQIEQLAWIPFFSGVGRVTQVIVSIISLAFLHWSLVLFALLSAFLMWSIPNLFHKKIEKLGKNCSQEQSVAISQLKDLFSEWIP